MIEYAMHIGAVTDSTCVGERELHFVGYVCVNNVTVNYNCKQ
ncbi:conserved protein of unknown function [Latilactobacillus sakei]|nr:conserved hypothetical protein [Latilactobacillus sakei]SOB38923.1 conserved hypothetical protein [Latilactobacillus sakei]SON69609.1 conserved protein of unknown function [Latilactobacillus sakei]